MDKNHTVIAEFSIIPIGQAGSSVGRYVAAAVNALKNVKGLDFEVTPMGTILAAKDLDTIFEAVRQAHEAIIVTGVKRVSSTPEPCFFAVSHRRFMRSSKLSW